MYLTALDEDKSWVWWVKLRAVGVQKCHGAMEALSAASAIIYLETECTSEGRSESTTRRCPST